MNETLVRRWIWIGAIVSAVAWSLLTVGAYALIALMGNAAGLAGGYLAALAERLGVVVLVATWAVGMLGIAAAVALSLWMTRWTRIAA
jgi:hypothetical protein